MEPDITSINIWLGFIGFLIFSLIISNIYVSHKKSETPTFRTALATTLIWIASALIFNFLLWWYLASTGPLAVANAKSLAFFTGYLIEESLSMDNLFVFYLIFKQFKIPAPAQRTILTYGIWSAVVLRLIMIVGGVWLINRFHWLLYIMGAFLIFSGFKMLLITEENRDLHETATYELLARFFRLTKEIKPARFFLKKDGLWYATPLFVALIFIELSDIVFALDSIPAIFAITKDPFIIWTSNIFAIMGLRAMYFILAAMATRLTLLKYGIALVLVFVGFKMLVEHWYVISVQWSLLFIVMVLLFFSLLSLLKVRTPPRPHHKG